MPAPRKDSCWFAVMDSRSCRIFENTGNDFEPVLKLVETLKAEAVDQASDTPGSRSDTAQGQRSAMEEPDLKEQARIHFARQIAERLDVMAQNGTIRRLVIAAAPAMLGHIRDLRSSRLAGLIEVELNLDLGHADVKQLNSALSGALKG